VIAFTKPASFAGDIPSALESFRQRIDNEIAVARARHCDVRTLADFLDSRVDALRMQHALTAPAL
jgi:hypothetical protein